MKTKLFLTLIFLAFFSATLRLNAQAPGPVGGGGDDDGGCPPACIHNVLNISTGFDHSTSTYKTPLALESNWQLVAVPTNATLAPNPPTWVIPPNYQWSTFGNAQWISPFQNSAYSVNNWPPQTYGAFEFQNCFCLCQDGDVNIQFDLLADDAAQVFLDGNLIGSAMSGWHFQWGNRMIVNITTPLTAGQHCLTVKLYNGGGGEFGFALEGQATGANLQTAACCKPKGRICGTKINDVDCDGHVNANTDPGLAGWTIILKDNNGNVVGTQVTDAQGNYCFTELPAGNYTVEEANQAGWTQTFPAGGIHAVTLVPGDAVLASFGNCKSTNPCTDQSCHDNVLNISTGFDQASNSYQTPLSLETNWTLIGWPTNVTMAPNPPAWVITPDPTYWGNFPNAQWVSPFQNSAYTANNPASQGIGSFRFQKCFCLCEETDVRIRFDLMADDQVAVFLDGNPTPLVNGVGGWQAHFTLASQLNYDQVVTLGPGTHCLTVDLYNVGGYAMGFALEGTVTGANLLSSSCCIPQGRICGTKINDANCDGNIDPQVDLGLSGWTITLHDANGNVVGTQVTDAQGNYCFTNLAAGNYTVSETNQPGWTQTYPASGTHGVTLAPGGGAMATFANCQQGTPPCEFKPGFDAEINNCAVTFTGITGVPAGSQIVSVNWTFGDGSSSNLLNPVHFYSMANVYRVCLTITIFDGSVCCTREYCREITVTRECDGDCNIEADIDVNEENCVYDFSAVIAASGVPVTSFYWVFGDGTSGTGSTVTHQFLTAGSYHVCVYLFAEFNGRCCYKEICIDIDVDCDPCNNPDGAPAMDNPVDNKLEMLPGESKPGKEEANVVLTDKILVLNQNVPNPFAEKTVITWNIPVPFNKAQLIFTTAEGKTIKTYDIFSKGEGRLNVFADDLSHGTYNYTLVVDGKNVDSKRMMRE
jgi:hypothetical protein